MSFLDSVLSSIETGKPSRMPPSSTAASAPVSSSTAKAEARKPSTGPRDGPERRPVAAGTKRKAEEQLSRPNKLDTQASRKPTLSKPTITPAVPRPRPTTTVTPARRPVNSSAAAAAAPPKPAPVSSKPPPKGSYADLMKQAKALQDKAPTQVGMFKHQAVPKEKLSKMERKKRATEAQAKEKEARSSKKLGSAPGAKPGDAKFARKREPEELAYKGTAKPLQTPALPEYRGTAGLPSHRNPNDRRGQASRRPRRDEYLGTDEEDEGDYADEPDDYYSDASSDMEGGFDDMEVEEAKALAAAKREDEEEWRAELAAKQEKLERRNKLAALAARRR